jgi:hypothetical protein
MILGFVMRYKILKSRKNIKDTFNSWKRINENSFSRDVKNQFFHLLLLKN